jgi:hypothetical protein
VTSVFQPNRSPGRMSLFPTAWTFLTHTPYNEKIQSFGRRH